MYKKVIAEVISKIQNKTLSLGDLTEAQLDTKPIVLAAIQYGMLSLEYVSERLRDDEDVALAALEWNYADLEDASERLRHDPVFVRKVVNIDGRALMFVGKEMLDYPDIVLAALEEITYIYNNHLAKYILENTKHLKPEVAWYLFKGDHFYKFTDFLDRVNVPLKDFPEEWFSEEEGEYFIGELIENVPLEDFPKEWFGRKNVIRELIKQGHLEFVSEDLLVNDDYIDDYIDWLMNCLFNMWSETDTSDINPQLWDNEYFTSSILESIDINIPADGESTISDIPYVGKMLSSNNKAVFDNVLTFIRQRTLKTLDYFGTEEGFDYAREQLEESLPAVIWDDADFTAQFINKNRMLPPVGAQFGKDEEFTLSVISQLEHLNFDDGIASDVIELLRVNGKLLNNSKFVVTLMPHINFTNFDASINLMVEATDYLDSLVDNLGDNVKQDSLFRAIYQDIEADLVLAAKELERETKEEEADEEFANDIAQDIADGKI
jgi:hypothetical protein